MVIVGMLLVVALWWHCDDTVVSVGVIVFIVVALWLVIVVALWPLW